MYTRRHISNSCVAHLTVTVLDSRLNPSIIEFVGSPGVGKTTMAESLNRALRNDTVVMWCFSNPWPTVSGKLAVLLLSFASPLATIKALCLVHRARPSSTKAYSKAFLINGRRNALKIALRQSMTAFILDQGPLQEAIAIGERCALPIEADELLALAGAPYGRRRATPWIVIALTASATKVAERIANRRDGTSPFDQASVSDLVEQVEKRSQATATLLNALDNCHQVVIEQSTENSCHHAGQNLANRINLELNARRQWNG